MNRIWAYLQKHYSDIYKGILLIASLIAIVSFFPKEATFKYEYTKGRPWMHKDLIAPFDFAILKAPGEIENEKKKIKENKVLYFDFDISLNEQRRKDFTGDFDMFWNAKYGDDPEYEELRRKTLDAGLMILDSILTRGVIQPIPELEGKPGDYKIDLIIQNSAEKIKLKDIYNVHTAYEKIGSMLSRVKDADTILLKQLLREHIICRV